MRLEGKVAIVTGSGGGGTGRALARRFAREGAALVVSDTDDAGGREGDQGFQTLEELPPQAE